mgnify:CR=1 FL=1|jgi:hypothetical protein
MAIEFKVVQTPRPDRFEDLVNKWLNEGWELHGSPFISGTGQMAQALLKGKANGKTAKVQK